MKKYIACLFMIIDHVGLFYADMLPVNIYICFRWVGSLALPLFVYSLIFGFLHTRSAVKYFLRILSCALGTQLILQLAFPLSGQAYPDLPLNDCFILVLVFALLYAFELMLAAMPSDRIGSLHMIKAAADTHSDRYDVRIGAGRSGQAAKLGILIPALPGESLFLLSILLIFLSLILSILLPIDKAFWGMLVASVFYLLGRVRTRESRLRIILWFFLIAIIDFVFIYMSTRQISTNALSLLSVFVCFLPVSEKRPTGISKISFYLFYPLHILVLVLIRGFFLR